MNLLSNNNDLAIRLEEVYDLRTKNIILKEVSIIYHLAQNGITSLDQRKHIEGPEDLIIRTRIRRNQIQFRKHQESQ